MKKFWRENKFVIALFLIWRITLLLVGLVGFSLLTFKASFPKIDEMLISSGLPQWLWQWGNFDGVHYLDIAKNGYASSGLQVFFPVYPLLIRITSTITSGNNFIAGLLVSNSAFLIGAIVFFKLVSNKFGLTTARWSLLFLFLFPTSFFYGAIYTEAIFFALVILSYSENKWIASTAAFLSGCTRLVGGFLASGIFDRPKRLLVVMSAFGVFTFMIYLGVNFGRPLYFLDAQGSFKNGRANSLTTLVSPPQVIFRYLKIFQTADPAHYDYKVAVGEFSAFIFGILLLSYLTWKRSFPVSWLVFSWGAVILPSFSGTLSSMPRYLLAAFPIFIALGMIKSTKIKTGILFIFGVLLLLLTVLYTRGYWVS